MNNKIETINKTKPKFNASITGLGDEGRGIAKNEAGKTVFIDNALPGEDVTYIINKKTKNYDEASAVSILNNSSIRVEPKCSSFGICGGCSIQHIDHLEQIKHKQNVLLSHLKHFGKVAPNNILEPTVGPQYHYRNKARLGVRFVEKKNKVLVGFREKNSNFLADIGQCEILNKQVGLNINKLEDLILSLEIYKSIAQIEVAAGDENIALIFRNLHELNDKDLEKLINFGKELNFHIYMQPKGIDSIRKIYPDDEFNRLTYTIADLDIKMQFHPTDFTQVNSLINNKMVQLALKYLEPKPEDNILDLFCGIGNFSLPIAKFANKVTGVEGSSVMVDRAYENSKLNNIDNTEFFAADLTKIDNSEHWLNKSINKVLIDPPRSGAEHVINVIASCNIEKIVYISCNTATLARDAGILVNKYGYNLEHVGILDMFAQTSHTESIAVFSKI